MPSTKTKYVVVISPKDDEFLPLYYDYLETDLSTDLSLKAPDAGDEANPVALAGMDGIAGVILAPEAAVSNPAIMFGDTASQFTMRVNVIRKGMDVDGVVTGYNTEYIGFHYACLKGSWISPRDAVLFVGVTGSARSAVYALNKLLRVTQIYVVEDNEHDMDDFRDWLDNTTCFTNRVDLISISDAARFIPMDTLSHVFILKPLAEEGLYESVAGKVLRDVLDHGTPGILLDIDVDTTPSSSWIEHAEDEGWKVILRREFAAAGVNQSLNLFGYTNPENFYNIRAEGWTTDRLLGN